MNLNEIKEPSDIKTCSIKELNQLAFDIRDFLIESISKTGGHLGSSLGTVELIIALHYSFNSPEDKLIFDIGHQAYTHKILTGRMNKFDTLRKYKGLSGFLKTSESIHDVWEAGHSSTSLSAAAGFSYARDLNEKNHNVVSIIGDGSLTNGMSMEALNHIIELNHKNIIIINDNEMSISSNIGFIDNLLKNLEINNSYDNTKYGIKNTLNKINSSGNLANNVSKIKEKIKSKISPAQSFFNIMGFKYIGVVDGHNIEDILSVFEKAKKYDRPVIIHVKTTKGKGYKPAEVGNWHAIDPFDIKSGELIQKKETISNSDFVSNVLLDCMTEDESINIISPAMFKGSSLTQIKEKYSNRITDCGIAEEHAATMAAAVSLSGKKTFLSIYSTFFQRCYDQVFHDIVRQNAPVVIGMDRSGLVGADGETHQGIYDISLLVTMPNIIISHPREGKELGEMISLAFESDKPFVIRYQKGGNNPTNVKYKSSFKLGTWDILRFSKKINIITYGSYVDELLEFLPEEIGIINARFIKPLDYKVLNKLSDSLLVVVEEHIKNGGLGDQILRYYNQNNINSNVHVRAISDNFIEQGDIMSLRKQEGLDKESIKKFIYQLLGEK